MFHGLRHPQSLRPDRHAHLLVQSWFANAVFCAVTADAIMAAATTKK